MNFYHKRTRMTYWSLSDFSKSIRSKFGLDNPSSLSLEDWDTHHEQSKQKSPIINWITDEGFDIAQDVVYFIPDIIHTFRTASLWKYFRNLYVFRKVLWNYRSWDYSGMLQFMETSARDMSECTSKYSHHLDSDQSAKELLIFAEHLKRIREDAFHINTIDYIDGGKGILSGEFVNKPNHLPSYKAKKGFHKIEESVMKNHLHEAAKLFERKLKSWWS